MRLWTIVLGVSAFLLYCSLGEAGPLKGPKKLVKVYQPGGYVYQETFKGGQRACVIIVGDHDPVVALRLKILDQNNKVVAQDEGQDESGRDFVTAIWHPERDAEYFIHFEFESHIANKCIIVFK